MATISKYTLDTINEIIFKGFNYELPSETLNLISELSLQVGSPDYIKPPVFQKRENPLKVEPSSAPGFRKKRGNKGMEVTDDNWESLKTFQTTKLEEKTGLDAQIDIIRTQLNKLTDKNYIDIYNKIVDIIDQNIIIEDMGRVSLMIFDIASTNRFYSKMYADLYSELSTKYEIMRNTIDKNLENFTSLFNTIEYVDPNVNYDKFCELNKVNEKRKALGAFYLNLMENGVITNKTIITITVNLLEQIYTFISEDNKKNEVDELTENVAILYKKSIFNDADADSDDDDYTIEGFTVSEIIDKISKSKVKDYKSLTNKTLFKFMDMVEM